MRTFAGLVFGNQFPKVNQFLATARVALASMFRLGAVVFILATTDSKAGSSHGKHHAEQECHQGN